MVDIIAPVTDYIPDSVLTIRGDLLKRGVVDVERFPVGIGNRFLQVTSSGLDLYYGGLANGMFQYGSSTYNAALVNIPAGGIELLEHNLGEVGLGEGLQVNALLKCTKGGVAGTMDYHIRKSAGTAIIQSFATRTNIRMIWSQPSSALTMYLLSGIFRVLNAGTLVFQAWGVSTGSDSACAIGDAQLYVNRIIG